MGAPGKPEYYSISDLKSRMLNIAQTSLYHVKFEFPTSISSFVGQRGIVSGDISNIELLCSEATLPGTSLSTHDVTSDYHGVTEKMAYRRKFDESLNLTFYVDRNYKVIEYFDGWIDYITGGSPLQRSDYKSPYVNYRMNYPSSYKCDMYIVKYEKDIGTTLNYTFVKAFPVSVVSTPVKYEESQLLKYNISFSYIRYVRERNTIEPLRDLTNAKAPGVAELNGANFSQGPSSELDKIRAAAALATIGKAENGLGPRILEGRGRSDEARTTADNAFNVLTR
jgi:hypothetical protein